MNLKVNFIIFFMVTALVVQTPIFQIKPADASGDPNPDPVRETKAQVATSEGNVYVTWWSNKTGGWEVLFRASNDGGEPFGDKINLSNSSGMKSVDAEIAADGENVYITWWERNSMNNEPVLMISNDDGQTFGPILNLATNGTIVNNQE